MQKWRSLVETTKRQIYISRIRDPFLNLSIEHFLLQKSAPHSTILFLYINNKCAVIGRNQNPWLEVDLGYLRSQNGDLVRRRSGGGTVFHDAGNVNYSVICPTADFTRDKHAEMVTKAIRVSNDRVRVNERHDIVLDRAPLLHRSQMPPESDMHRTRYGADEHPLKVSGSAYKMIRNRCLHHGTCLVALPNLKTLNQALRSPARAFIKAKGVESVRSNVGNIARQQPKIVNRSEREHVPFYTDRIQRQIVTEFMNMYGPGSDSLKQQLSSKQTQTPTIWSESDWAGGFVGAETLEVPEIAEGVEELKSSKWIYGQTPEFTLSSQASNDDGQEGQSSTDPPMSTEVYLKARGGVITETSLSCSLDEVPSVEQKWFDTALKGKRIDEVENFVDITVKGKKLASRKIFGWMIWLNKIFAKSSGSMTKRLILPQKES